MKLIDKDAVVAEIEKIIADETESIKSFEHGKNVSEVQRSNARIGVLMHIRSLLDTLEVKEVDLEKHLKEDIEDTVHGTVDYPLIGCDFPNIFPNYKELKEYCDRNGIKDNDKVKLIIIKDV